MRLTEAAESSFVCPVFVPPFISSPLMHSFVDSYQGQDKEIVLFSPSLITYSLCRACLTYSTEYRLQSDTKKSIPSLRGNNGKHVLRSAQRCNLSRLLQPFVNIYTSFDHFISWHMRGIRYAYEER